MDTVYKGFIIPDNKYFLTDTGYNYSHRLLILFRGIQYYLQETMRYGL